MIEEVCRPVLFEQSDEYAPYWGRGSSVLVASSNHYYWVTAAHVIKNMGGSTDSVRIFPSEASRVSLPFNQQYQIQRDEDHNDDYKDIVVFRIDLHEFTENGDVPLTAQDIKYGAIPAESLPKGARLLVIGYPSDGRAVDYDEFKIKYKRQWIFADYLGTSAEQHCHSLRVSESVKVNDYDGLSGSPVFYMKEAIHNGSPAIMFLLVGLILRGSAESRIAHFVSANVLINLIQKAENENA